MAGTPVTVDTQSITDLGNKIKKLEAKLDHPTQLLTGLTVTPGEFDAGTNLKTIVEKRGSECLAFLTAVKDQLEKISSTLTGTTTTTYDNNEVDNTDTASASTPS